MTAESDYIIEAEMLTLYILYSACNYIAKSNAFLHTIKL